CVGLLCGRAGSGLHELDGDHRTLSANLANDVVRLLQALKLTLQRLLNAGCFGKQALLLDGVKDGDGRCCGDGVSSERATEATSMGSIHDFGAAGDGSEGQSAGDSLGGKHEVRHEAE